MKAVTKWGALTAPFRRFRWRLILSYNLVTLAALFLLGWWGLVAGTIYLLQFNPDETWVTLVGEQIMPALVVILPSAAILIIPAVLVSAYFGFLNARWLDIRLANLRKALKAWQQGDFSEKVQDNVADEIGSFGSDLNEMAARMQGLLHSHEDLAALEERNRLARDLHDAVKQQITAASFQIGAAKALLDSNRDAAYQCLGEAEKLAHTAHQELNSIIFELRAIDNTPGDLVKAISAYVEGWARQNPIAARTQLAGGWNPGTAMQQDIMRFLQEALSNVARHSRASQVDVCLSLEGDSIKLSIQDNGQGFEPDDPNPEGFGFKTMEARIKAIGGELNIDSHPGLGTQVEATIMIKKKQQE